MLSLRHRALLQDIIRRLVGAMVVLWAAATATFIGLRLMPGSVEASVLGTHLNDPGLREQVRQSLGLDRPVIVQYGSYLLDLLQGDFGRSFILNADVSDVIGQQLGATVELALAAILLAMVLAWTIVITTAGSSRRVQSLLHVGELAAICLPTFWMGSLLLLAFSFRVHWFPAVGDDGVRSLVLPSITLALPVAGLLSQFMREEIGMALRQPWTLTVRSRGVSVYRLRAAHLVPHAAVASLTVVGNVLGALIGGTVIVETVFARPGLGRIALAAVNDQDAPVLIAVVLVITTAYVLITSVTDILAAIIDPRLRKERS